MNHKSFKAKVIVNAGDLGETIRAFRKGKNLTQKKVSGISNVGTRFLSELERGKETAELGKSLQVLYRLGLEVIIKPRYIIEEDSDLLC